MKNYFPTDVRLLAMPDKAVSDCHPRQLRQTLAIISVNREGNAMLNIIGAIVSGLIVGALARYFYPGEVEMSWLMTIVLGVAGSLLAGLVTASRSTGGVREGVSRAGCFASLLGAMLLILIGRLLGWS